MARTWGYYGVRRTKSVVESFHKESPVDHRHVVRLITFFISFLALVSLCAFGQATETVLYSFGTNGIGDGIFPTGSITFDKSGNLYGVTADGGLYGGSMCSSGGCGTLYELTPSGNSWSETVLYDFCASGANNCPDGETPSGGLISDSAGNLYGTTIYGGGPDRAGTVFELSRSSNPAGAWTETVLWSFGANKNDGLDPDSSLTWDTAGNLYGTTAGGGANNGHGTVFELSPVSGGGWTETVLHSFGAGTDGQDPEGGVVFDKSGNAYGSTYYGGTAGYGVIYKLTRQAGGSWSETVLYNFDGSHAGNPIGNLTFDATGNLYGAFVNGGRQGDCFLGVCGGVFQFSPKKAQWFLFNGTDGGQPVAGLLVDNNTGALFGVSLYGSPSIGAGSVFEIKPGKETVLYSFCSQYQCSDGEAPNGPLFEHAGKLYGVTGEGGLPPGNGVVYQIRP
jgi:uncharacterized repeat protein (TIGR03803 family)